MSLLAPSAKTMNNWALSQYAVDKPAFVRFLSTNLFMKIFATSAAGEDPLDQPFGQKTDHSECQSQKNHKGTQFSCFGFPGQLTNDEQHVEHENPNANGHAEPGELFFGKAHRAYPASLSALFRHADP